MAIKKNKEVYKGKIIKQKKGIVKVFDSFFKKEKFKNIVEIGTGNGAFSTYFAKKAKDMGSSFITYDIKKISKKVEKELLMLGGTVVTCDINKSTDVENIIADEGRFLLLNDGGLKVPEFLRFAKLIKVCDIILTHDYYKDRKTTAGIVVIEDVKKCIEKNNLEIINEELFDDALWLCVKRTAI
jgi:hypothetical protein